MAFGARLGVKAGKLTGKLAKKVKHALSKDRFNNLQATAKKFSKDEHGGSSGKGKGSNKTSELHNNDYVKNTAIDITKSKFGHTFERHGQNATNFLIQRAKKTGKPQGQFLDDQLAARFIQNNLDKIKGEPISLPVPEGFFVRIINPDGSFSVAKTI